MTADAMANAPVISDDDHDDDVENQGDPHDGLVGVEDAETNPRQTNTHVFKAHIASQCTHSVRCVR